MSGANQQPPPWEGMKIAIGSVLDGHAQRIAAPGSWKVWRDGRRVIVEVMEGRSQNV